jgi:hypothetical protein
MSDGALTANCGRDKETNNRPDQILPDGFGSVSGTPDLPASDQSGVVTRVNGLGRSFSGRTRSRNGTHHVHLHAAHCAPILHRAP